MSVVAELDDVSLDYPTPTGTVHGILDVSLTIGSATTTAIHGRSGSGKSTLVSVLALLRQPTRGTVRSMGEDMTALPRSRVDVLRPRRVGVAFQSYHLEGSLTAAENVMLPWSFGQQEVSRRAATLRADELLDSLEIKHLSRRRPAEMSGGQRQRVSIARAMFANPPLLLADEPTGNLDEVTAGEVAERLYSLAVDFGTAVVIVTHDRAVAAMAGRQVQITRARLTPDTGPS